MNTLAVCLRVVHNFAQIIYNSHNTLIKHIVKYTHIHVYKNICFIHVSITPLVPINNTKKLFYVESNVISYYYDCLKYYMRCNYILIWLFGKKKLLSR